MALPVVPQVPSSRPGGRMILFGLPWFFWTGLGGFIALLYLLIFCLCVTARLGDEQPTRAPHFPHREAECLSAEHARPLASGIHRRPL